MRLAYSIACARSHLFLGCGLAAAFVSFGTHHITAAEPPPLPASLMGHLEAGEFGPAQKLAGSLPDEQRDEAFAAIAKAQGAAGNRLAAANVLPQIKAAPLRQQTADQLSKAAQSSLAGALATGKANAANAPQTSGPDSAGGQPVADFDSLIELITSTISPNSWDEVGGPGSISGFEGGVKIDTTGMLAPKTLSTTQGLEELRKQHQSTAASTRKTSSTSPRHSSAVRKVSLNRLELALQQQYAQGKTPTAEMQNLAGLHRVQYVFLYPETGDVVLAGPADDWLADDLGRSVSVTAGNPTLQLDDLVVALRSAALGNGKFGCSITPSAKGLAEAQEVANRWAQSPLRPGQRNKWLGELRSAVGPQSIEVYGIDPQSHASRVIVEADYHMKRVGMGLEKGVLGVESYLDLLAADPSNLPEQMSVLRWWFTLSPEHLTANADFSAFELRGASVRVESENEKLTADGERVHTGKSNPANQQFASNFTKHYEKLAAKYPVYAELRNVFDLTLVAAIVSEHRLDDRANWQMSHFAAKGHPLVHGELPKTVDTIMNYRETSTKQLLAGVSGGVTVNAHPSVAAMQLEKDTYQRLPAPYAGSKPKAQAATQWWWD